MDRKTITSSLFFLAFGAIQYFRGSEYLAELAISAFLALMSINRFRENIFIFLSFSVSRVFVVLVSILPTKWAAEYRKKKGTQ